MPELVPQQPPPPDYYARNLRTVLEFVDDFHRDLLTASERAYITTLLGASVRAQRLYARLLGRKGPWIRIDKLNYSEVDDLDLAVSELQALHLVSVNGAAPADALLGLLTQAQRHALYPGVRGASKTQWLNDCVGRFSDTRIRACVAATYPWISVTDYQRIRLCQLLFFGDEQQDGSAFVLRDLGLMQYEPYALNPSERLFNDGHALDRYRKLRRLSHLSHRLNEVPDLAQWLADLNWQQPASRFEQRLQDKTLNRLARWFERRGEFDQALACYGRSRIHPSRERRARILKKLEDDVGVGSLVARISTTPRCAEEVDFANRFGHSRRGAIFETTEIPLHEPPTTSIEAHAVNILGAGGGAVFHLENSFPLGLAALAFWEVIFAPIPGSFVNPFQSGPLDLFWPDFAATREAQLRCRQAQLEEPECFRRALRSTYESKAGTANRLMSWRHFNTEVLKATLENIPAHALLSLANHVIRWPYRTRNGFPDLLVIYGPDNFEFVEVKGPTDQLQPAQRVWLKALADMNLTARVLKFKAC